MEAVREGENEEQKIMAPKIRDINTDELRNLIAAIVRETIEDMNAQDPHALKNAGNNLPTRNVGPLKDESFVGIWKDREDMAESPEWVRDTRRREWDTRNAGKRAHAVP